jgi:hypothetical protein
LKRRHEDIEHVGVVERDNPLQVDHTLVSDDDYNECIASLQRDITDTNAGLLQIAPPIVHDIGR